MKYKLIRSERTTITIQIKPEGVVVRAPKRTSRAEIEAFIKRKENWIRTHLQKLEEKKKMQEALVPLTPQELKALKEAAKKKFRERVIFYGPMVGVSWGNITIRAQKSRWGSASTRGNLSFNCLLMLAPPQVLDAIVVHELCHLIEMNHSPRFYREVLRVYPEYRTWFGWLKEHGDALLKRLPG